jgi:uncharacterized protein (DUF488 family)
MQMANTVYTIGHSTHAIERFLELLKGADIEVVGDVRSRPYSRMNPHFNREPLKEALVRQGIKYVFVGKELGARSEDRSVYVNGQAKYELIARTELFKSGIDRVAEGAEKHRIALMCAEKEPLDCHRTILVSRRLSERGLNIAHILSDGSIESHEHALERLISKLGVPGEDMFRAHNEVVEEAYAKRGKEIAYQEIK